MILRDDRNLTLTHVRKPAAHFSGRPNLSLPEPLDFVCFVCFVCFAPLLPARCLMKTLETVPNRLVTPGVEEVRQARVAARLFAASTGVAGSVHRIRISPADGSSKPVEVPESAFRLFLEVLNQMAQGNAVTLVPTHHELTTQEAADLLGVSRPYFVKLLEGKAIPHHRVGSRRRVKFEHLMTYMEKAKGESREALDALGEDAQKLGMGY